MICVFQHWHRIKVYDESHCWGYSFITCVFQRKVYSNSYFESRKIRLRLLLGSPSSELRSLSLQQPAPEHQTGTLLIYIITNVPIPLYQVNYAPYLILILLWEPGSVSASPGNHQVSISSTIKELSAVSATLERSVWNTPTVVSRLFQQTTESRHCFDIF